MALRRFIAFLLAVLGVWAAVHLYVFWRLASIPFVAKHVPSPWLIAIAAALYVSYPVARIVGRMHVHAFAVALEFVAATWMGLVFLLFAMLLAADVFTVGGLLFRSYAGTVRSGAAVAGMALAVVASIQGLRPPAVSEHVVELRGLPPALEGRLLVLLSDLHLGTLISRDWLGHLVDRVNGMNPELIVIAGDLVDSDADRLEPFVPVLRRLQAPLGVWAATGNHEFYSGLERSVAFMEKAGIRMLRDAAAEAAPGLILAGVDDLSARGRRGGADDSRADGMDHPLERALRDAGEACAILLSHSPVEYERAAALGAQLMLSGHTHNGQVWPFNYIVRARYPLIHGRYDMNGMILIVSRGVGTWGPRMRLWKRGEIVGIRLKRAEGG